MARKTAFLALCLAPLLSGCGVAAARDFLPWRHYYAASHSMEPTLPKGTRFWGWWVNANDLARGDIVVVHTPDNGDYISRIAALPGDRIATKNGIVVLNGTAVKQQRNGGWHYDSEVGEVSGKVFLERFPGEKSPHRIIDTSATKGDQLPELVIPADRYFLLGDNRDHAADSRFPVDQFGLGMVRGDQIAYRIDTD